MNEIVPFHGVSLATAGGRPDIRAMFKHFMEPYGAAESFADLIEIVRKNSTPTRRSKNQGPSAAIAIILVLLNFVLSAWLLAWAARTSLALLMGVALFGYLARLALITVAVLAITGQSWFSPIPLCATLVLTHLGLLIWETRFVSATLAYPGLKPRRVNQKGS